MNKRDHGHVAFIDLMNLITMVKYHKKKTIDERMDEPTAKKMYRLYQKHFKPTQYPRLYNIIAIFYLCRETTNQNLSAIVKITDNIQRCNELIVKQRRSLNITNTFINENIFKRKFNALDESIVSTMLTQLQMFKSIRTGYSQKFYDIYRTYFWNCLNVMMNSKIHAKMI